MQLQLLKPLLAGSVVLDAIEQVALLEEAQRGMNQNARLNESHRVEPLGLVTGTKRGHVEAYSVNFL